jgi:hypothetical protein
MVSDLVINLGLYYRKKTKVGNILENSEQKLTDKKLTFDNIWRQRYSENSEYWTFETIVQKYKDSLNSLKKLKGSIFPHLEAISKSSLLVRMLKLTEEICERDCSNEIQTYISLDTNILVDKLLETQIGNQATYEKLLNAGETFESDIDKAKVECKRVYLDIISKLPRSLACRILIQLGAKCIHGLRRVSKSWNSLLRVQMLWRCFSYINGWGIAFIYPKNIDWEIFYHTLSRSKKSKISSAIENFNYEMAGTSGVKAQKKMNAFLKKMPVESF